MGGLLDALTSGGNALQGQQFGAQVTGGNVANANAPGYHRVDAVIDSSGALGTGALTTRGQRSGLSFLDANVNTQTGALAYSESRYLSMNALQNAVGNLGDSGLGSALEQYFSGWRALSSNPQDQAVRVDVLGRAQNVASTLRAAAQDVATQRKQLDTQIVGSVEAINTQIEAVAAYNRAIVAQGAGSVAPSDLQDKRDAALTALASTLGATSSTDPNGQISVYIGGGVSIVSGAQANLLETTTDATTGLHHVEVQKSTAGSLDARLTSGTIGALLLTRDNDLAASANALDAIAYDFINATNAVHAANYGLDGVGGRQLFVPHAQSGAAAAMAIESSVAGNPSFLAAAASAAGAPGDGAGASQMVAVEDQQVAAGNSMTLLQEVNNLVQSVGHATGQANASVLDNGTALQYAKALAQTQSGVSVEEQMMQLTHYQAGFQAATRFIHVIDEMIASLQAM